MTTNLVDRVSVLTQLGKALRTDEQFQAACGQAGVTNPFFTKEFVEYAVDSVCREMLDETKLSAWLKNYPALSENKPQKKVGIIMAGNIPLVGFHDFLCVFLSGFDVQIKLSSKDDKLFPALLNVLSRIDTSLKGKVQLAE